MLGSLSLCVCVSWMDTVCLVEAINVVSCSAYGYVVLP